MLLGRISLHFMAAAADAEQDPNQQVKQMAPWKKQVLSHVKEGRSPPMLS